MYIGNAKKEKKKKNINVHIQLEDGADQHSSHFVA